ncbi:MAG: endolytic transglycosylase MltG [Candidatus Taylorbacteria bacterium]|nr:endolytic transglycosylase MltG [Candidatus Taylorbacteria bacterium]
MLIDLIKKHLKLISGVIFFVCVLAIVLIIWNSLPPRDFPADSIVSIKEGSGLNSIALQLAEDHIIKSAFLYKAYSVILRDGHSVQAGDYLFDSPQSVLRVAYRMVNGIYDLPRIKIMVPEGMASFDIAKILIKNISNFDEKAFLVLAKPKEGYLFPDTYYFQMNTTPEQAMNEMTANLQHKIQAIQSDISLFGRSTDDVIKMASIIEKEATSSADRRIIAGILWKRLDSKYPLQVDPPFYYILNKDSAKLTLDDLNIDSPYNLYKHLGLPPTAIGNPGLEAISDTVNPTKTDFWYYLSDSKGNMHYAKSYEGHLANKEKYVR